MAKESATAAQAGTAALGPRLDEELEALECNALLIVAASAKDPDLAAFVGPVHVHSAFLLAPKGGEAHLGYFTPMERDEAARTGLSLLTPEALDIPRWIQDGASEVELMTGVLTQGLIQTGVGRGQIALAGHAPVGTVTEACRQLEADGWSVVAGHDLVRRLRKRKNEAMATAVGEAAAGVCEAFRAVASLLAGAKSRQTDGVLVETGEPVTGGRIRRLVARVLAEHGLSQPEGNIVAAGADGATPHTAGADDRALRAGESLVVDLYPKGELFADCTRTFCVGTPSDALARAHATVLEALELAHNVAVVGERGWDLQESICGFIQSRGYETPISNPGTERGYVHGLGHGVGYDLHEYPSFRRHSGPEGILEPGDVLTLEPGLYDEEEGYGVRLEDLVILRADGATNLTPLPYDLDPGAWLR